MLRFTRRKTVSLLAAARFAIEDLEGRQMLSTDLYRVIPINTAPAANAVVSVPLTPGSGAEVTVPYNNVHISDNTAWRSSDSPGDAIAAAVSGYIDVPAKDVNHPAHTETFALDDGSGTTAYRLVSGTTNVGFEVYLPFGSRDYTDYYLEFTVQKLAVNSVTLASSAYSPNRVTTDGTTTPTLYVGPDSSGNAQVHFVSTENIAGPEAASHALWTATAGTTTLGSGNFSTQSNSNYVILNTGTGTATFSAGADSNNDGTLESNEITQQVTAILVNPDQLTVTDDSNTSNNATATAAGTIPDLYITKDSNGNGQITLTLPDISDPTQRATVAWAVYDSGGLNRLATGTFASDPTITLPIGSGSTYLVDSGFDTNLSGSLGTNEITRSVRVHLVNSPNGMFAGGGGTIAAASAQILSGSGVTSMPTVAAAFQCANAIQLSALDFDSLDSGSADLGALM